jgi:serine/threonine protein kinase
MSAPRTPSSPASTATPRTPLPSIAQPGLVAPIPPHLSGWQLPPGWAWGTEGLTRGYRHYHEVRDGLGRSLSLVTVPDPVHEPWLFNEARNLGVKAHGSIPTTYHYWSRVSGVPRGPGYLRRWISGETVKNRLQRAGQEDLTTTLQLARTIGGALAYLHSGGTTHGALGGETIWITPTGQLWLLGWEWALPKGEIPQDVQPDRAITPIPPEWGGGWFPTPASDQWQLAATCFAALTGEYPPPENVPPVDLVRPDCPHSVSLVLERALSEDPAARFDSLAGMLRTLDRAVGGRTSIYVSGASAAMRLSGDTEEARLRWATGEDYEVLSRLGSGTFGSVWRVRDLALEREVALKMLHPRVASDENVVRRFRREAQLAAQLAHPAIVPIYDFDSNAGVSWYTMELAEGGSLADVVSRAGARPLAEIAPQLDQVLDGLAAAHAVGVIHRDLKPENILIDRYRRWRIADFGVARVFGEDYLSSTTGTPEFAAPEQLLGEPQGPAVDCFEMAGIVYFLLTGNVPFGSGEGETILARQLQRTTDLEALDDPIARWLRRGLAPLPAERFADAGVMRDAWRKAVDDTLVEEHAVPWWRRWLTADADSAT